MALYRDRILPRMCNVLMRNSELTPIRARVAAGLAGDVLEVGFGSGLNVPHYPPAVRRVLAIDPALVSRKLAAERVAASPVPVEYVGLDGQRLPVETQSVDHVLSTWTLCSIPDLQGALGEIRRVLRPGGQFHFAEHGRSPEASVARWQDRLTPLQRRILGGCHLNRRIADLIADSGLKISTLETYYLAGPKPLDYTYEGIAVKV